MALNVTYEDISKIANTKIGPLVRGFVDGLKKHGDKYGVNTYLRVCHFIAQCAQESARFNTLEEYASGAAYEGRHDLGNIHPGDGKKYKGRGYIQLTGRANYERVGKILGYDLVNNPQLVQDDPEVGLLVSLEYWKSRNINLSADKDNVVHVTELVNGGDNGLVDRKKYLANAKAILKDRGSITVVTPPAPPPPVVVAPPPTTTPTTVVEQKTLFQILGDLLRALFGRGITDGK